MYIYEYFLVDIFEIEAPQMHLADVLKISKTTNFFILCIMARSGDAPYLFGELGFF